ncbi:MAG: T9SS type A sorting domain-containing protein [Saprospiraceae bacterium]|nr:T9SS type A sorting domain-containing protein [Saprospiraceae bacterium]
MNFRQTLFLLSCCSIFAQTISAQNCATSAGLRLLETDNFQITVGSVGISGYASTNGIYFKNDTGTLHNTIYSTGLWMGGYDNGSNLLVAAQSYPYAGNNGTDYSTGPLVDSTGTIADSSCAAFDQVWIATESDIRALITDYQDNGYIDNPIPQDLLKWPAIGNPHFSALLNFDLPDQELAPFYDINGDGIYDPNDGDYPVFEHGNPNAIASQMTWSVYNDNGKVHAHSNSARPLKMEIQTTTYLFECPGNELLDSVIFVKHKLVSNNPLPIYDFKIGFWNDFDLGCFEDDYLGTDSTLNTIYVYNGDNKDDVPCGQHMDGFGAKPPVQAVTVLNTNITNSSYTTNGLGGMTDDPISAPGFYNLMSGYWSVHSPTTPTPITYGGTGLNISGSTTTPANFVFPSQPSDASNAAWSMVSDTILARDYRMMMSTSLDSISPYATVEYDLAYTFIRDTSVTDQIAMADLVPQVIPRVQQIYDDNFSSVVCAQNTTLNVKPSQTQYTNALISAYPNPAQNQINIDFQNVKGAWNVQLVDIMGRRLIQKNNIHNTQTQLNVEDLPAGIYFYQVTSEEGILIHTEKIQIQ